VLYGDQKYQVCSSSGLPEGSLPSAAPYKHEFAIAVVSREGKSVKTEFQLYLLLINDKGMRI
jgi:hypothetical protein